MVKKRQKTRRKRQKCQQNHGFGNLNPLQGLYALTGQLGRIHVYTCPILGRFTPFFGHFLPLFDLFLTSFGPPNRYLGDGSLALTQLGSTL